MRKIYTNERIERAESFFRAVGVQVWAVETLREVFPITVPSGTCACYLSKMSRGVFVPRFDRFPDASQYYSMLAHETIHWTSHKTRCNRKWTSLDEESYAIEELTAEYGSVLTLGRLGLKLTLPEEYAGGSRWLKVLKYDKHAILKALDQAKEAADWLASRAAR